MSLEGFFSTKEVGFNKHSYGKPLTCASCGLYKTCKFPKMEPFGNFKKGILNVGEAPGSDEDRRGKPWQGKTGRLLQRTYKSMGIDLFEDCLNINAVSCRPTDSEGRNRTPTNYEIDCCRRRVLSVIRKYKPKIIVLFGNSAIYSVIGHRVGTNVGGIQKWRGFRIPDEYFGAWICPVFHPSYVERSEEHISTIWEDDLHEVINLVGTGYPPEPKSPEIEFIDDLSPLKEITSDRIAFDYETTGKKPQATGHRIICTSVADSPDHAFVFMMPKSKKERQPFIDLLTNPKVKKMAHNMKFEDTWTVEKLKVEVKGWDWDSMIAAHIIDNRSGITGLKFQTYINFGIVGYEEEIAPYLRANTTEHGANAINNIMELVKTQTGRRKLMTYCALDSIYEYRLALKQQHLIRIDNLPF